MATYATVGDPTNLSVFDEEQEIVSKSGLKILSKESYANDLLKVYEEYFENSTVSLNFSLNPGDVVSGKISSITNSEIALDISGKEYAYISLDKEKLDPANYSVGETIDVVITEASECLRASITGKIKKDLYDDMADYKSKTTYDAKVVGLSNNGYDLNIGGLPVFMPGSLGGINKLTNFEELVGETIKVMAIKNNNKYSKFRDTLIVSHRDYLETLIPAEVDKLIIGNEYSGVITGTNKYGVFVEFKADENGPSVLTGLIHKDEFDEVLAGHYNEGALQPGVEIAFYLKEVVTNKRIILSRNEVEKSEPVKKEYKRGDVVNGKVTAITNFGVFVKFAVNTSGLIHISKLKDITLTKGQKVSCKITNINDDKYDLKLAK